jgi:hypothetical protein
MREGLKQLNIHDIWLSVLNWHTHVIIEFGYSPASWYIYKLCRALEMDDNIDSPDVALEKIFFCDYCDEWTISQDMRERLLES